MKYVICSWSGGKDSVFACYKALERKYNVKYLLNFISKKYKRCSFHGIPAELIKLQAETIGIPLFQKEVSDDMKEYENEFKDAVNTLKKYNIQGMVFGDIYLEEHKKWVERVCKELGIECIEPLWGESTEEIIKNFINTGFKAIVVSCKADLFNKEFVGREINQTFLDELKVRNICPCGENGEFHTFVFDGPIFKKKIEIVKAEPILRSGFWKHWFLDIQEYRIIEKY
jgi:uncharacterized protein (TIGR00290 family)